MQVRKPIRKSVPVVIKKFVHTPIERGTIGWLRIGRRKCLSLRVVDNDIDDLRRTRDDLIDNHTVQGLNNCWVTSGCGL